MNEHIFIELQKDQTPAVSLVAEKLSDGSKVYSLICRSFVLDCVDEKRGRETMALLTAALNHCAAGKILHL